MRSRPVGSAATGGGTALPYLTMSGEGATSRTATLTMPEGATLVEWELQYKESTSETWLDYANGITGSAQVVVGLDGETQYDFRPIVTEIVTGGAATITTGVVTGPPLTQWVQPDGSTQDFGSPLDIGKVWFAPSAPVTFEVMMRNDEGPIDAFQIPVESDVTTPGSMLGFAIQGGEWNTDTTTVTPDSGASFDSPTVELSPILELATPVDTGDYMRFQQLLGAGLQTPGKNFGTSQYPQTGICIADGFEVADVLGTPVTPTGIQIGPFPSRAFLRLVDDYIYAFAPFGDSTVGMVQPVASIYSNSKEGVFLRANQNLRTRGKKVRAYSYGQGTASWAQIQARVRANLATMAGKITHILVQVWTWNTAHLSVEQAEAAWAEYLVLEADCIAAGFACSPFINNPYTTRNLAGQIAAFEYLKTQTLAHPLGIALDEIMGAADWPDLPSAWSEDDVHVNQQGAIDTATDIADELLRVATILHPELA